MGGWLGRVCPGRFHPKVRQVEVSVYASSPSVVRGKDVGQIGELVSSFLFYILELEALFAV